MNFWKEQLAKAEAILNDMSPGFDREEVRAKALAYFRDRPQMPFPVVDLPINVECAGLLRSFEMVLAGLEGSMANARIRIARQREVLESRDDIGECR